MSLRSLGALALVTLVPSVAFAHMEITDPTPRVQADNIKEANAPCGGPRGSTITQLTGGEMFTFQYDETIAHPGHFELRFSMAGDSGWQTLDGNIADQGGVGSYSHTFEVPNVNCTDCTIQFIQVMTDRNPPQNYYACFDVEITASGTPADMGMVPTPDMGTTPTPDMGTTNNTNPPANNTNPPANNNSPPANNSNPPANNSNPPANNSTSGSGTDTDTGGGSVNASGDACSTTPYKASGTPGWIFAVLGGALIAKRRRRSSRGSIAAR